MFSKKINIVLSISLLAMMLFAVAVPVYAATGDADDLYGLEGIGTGSGLGQKDLKETVGSLIKVALGFLGVIAIIIVLVGGFKYMIAGGSEDKVKEAKQWIISGVIGLAIILAAYAITSFVLTELIGATTEGGGTPSAD